jgi:hypothetical protein
MSGAELLKVTGERCGRLGEVIRWACRKCNAKICTEAASTDGCSLIHYCMGTAEDDSVEAVEGLAELWQRDREQWCAEEAVQWPQSVAGWSREAVGRRELEATGGCGCGACRFRCRLVAPIELQHCYCNLCRQHCGAAYMTWVPVQKENFEWLDAGRAGLELVRTTAHGSRHMCRSCGSVMSIIYDSQQEIIWPAAACFDVASPGFARLVQNASLFHSGMLGRVIHICCKWRQPWHVIPEDGMPRLDSAG